MRILRYIGVVLLLLILSIYIVGFTPFGNNLVANYISKKVHQESKMELKFNKFRINLSELEIKASLNDEINLDIAGMFSIFSQKMDLDYSVFATNLKTADIELKKPISIKGKVKGKINDFDINGIGDIFGSSISYLSNIKEYMPFTAKINAKKLEISEILAVAKQPNYAKGYIDIQADIKDENGKRDGKAQIQIYDGLVNNAEILKNFNINLPSNFDFKGVLDAVISNDKIDAKTLFVTPIATANTKNTTYDLGSSIARSDFNLNLADLSKLEPIINQKIQGSLNIDGNMEAKADKLNYLNANIKGFGGNISASLKDESLNAKIENIKLQELLKLASQPAFATALINGEASLKNINDTKNISGNLNIKTDNGKIIPSEFKKIAGVNMIDGVTFELNANTQIKKAIANFNINLLSSLINLKNLNGEFDIDKNDLIANFNIVAKDLSKFESMLGTKINGAVDISGKANVKNSNLNELNIAGKALSGDLKAVLKDKKLNANLSNLALKDIFVLIGQKPLANAVINANANLTSIDINDLNGDIDIKINNGEFYEKNMSEIMGKPFAPNVKFNAISDIKIAKSIANFNANVVSDLLNLKDIKGNFNIKDSSFQTTAKANIPDLRKLKFITEKELFGAINMDIWASKKGDDLTANLTSKIFNGDLKANIKNNIAKINLDKFNFKGLTDTLGMQNFYNGNGNADINYDTLTQKGTFKLDINEGKLANTKFTDTIKTFTTRDITQEVYKDGYVNGTINKGFIKFDMMMKAQRSDINATAATFDTITDKINIPLNFRYEKTDATINITGTSKEPKYSVKSEYLQNKIIKGIDKLIDKKLGGDKNSDTKDVVKGLIKGLF